MPTTTNQYEIVLGSSSSDTSQFLIQTTASTGTPGALRRITHPDAASPTITYQRNPDRTTNFLSQPLYANSGSARRTLGTTLPFVDESAIDDVIVTEVWEGSDRRAAMTTSFFKLLYEVWSNIPATGEFVIWDPRDLIDTGVQYNVTLLDIRVGGRSGRLDAKDFGSTIWQNLDVVTTGTIDRTVEMDFLIRSEV